MTRYQIGFEHHCALISDLSNLYLSWARGLVLRCGPHMAPDVETVLSWRLLVAIPCLVRGCEGYITPQPHCQWSHPPLQLLGYPPSTSVLNTTLHHSDLTTSKTPVSALCCGWKELCWVNMWRNWFILWRYHCLWCYHHHCLKQGYPLHPHCRIFLHLEIFLCILLVLMMKTVYPITNACNICVIHGRPAQDSGNTNLHFYTFTIYQKEFSHLI